MSLIVSQTVNFVGKLTIRQMCRLKDQNLNVLLPDSVRAQFKLCSSKIEMIKEASSPSTLVLVMNLHMKLYQGWNLEK